MEQNFWDKRLTTSRGILPRLFKKVLLKSIFSPFFFFFRLNGSRFGYATILLISKSFPGIFRSDDFTGGILVDESSREFFNRYRIWKVKARCSESRAGYSVALVFDPEGQ